MNCNSSHSLFLRSNGDLACWDDYGSLLTLLPFSPSLDYATDVYLGPVFNAIRDKLRAGEMPFPEYCSGCYCLMHQLKLDHYYEQQKLIETFQIEPSMACQLECPNCITKKERPRRVLRTPHGHLTLASSIVEKIVADLHRGGIRVQKFDFQGHGEPLLNRRTWEMAGFIANLYPRSVVSVCTNANFKFRPEMVHSGVNEMIFAIDEMDQPSYVPYRVAGEFDDAYGFMKAFSLAASSENPSIRRVWKYVVFEHNDLPAQLLRAQELALEAKVTELRFVLTQMGPLSWDVTDESHIPRLDPALNVVVDNYRIQLVQFETALKDLKSAIAGSDVEKSVQSANFFVNMLNRYFHTAPRISREHQTLIERFLELNGALPADVAAAKRARIDALRSEVRERGLRRDRPSLTVIQFNGPAPTHDGRACGSSSRVDSDLPACEAGAHDSLGDCRSKEDVGPGVGLPDSPRTRTSRFEPGHLASRASRLLRKAWSGVALFSSRARSVEADTREG